MSFDEQNQTHQSFLHLSIIDHNRTKIVNSKLPFFPSSICCLKVCLKFSLRQQAYDDGNFTHTNEINKKGRTHVRITTSNWPRKSHSLWRGRKNNRTYPHSSTTK